MLVLFASVVSFIAFGDLQGRTECKKMAKFEKNNFFLVPNKAHLSGLKPKVQVVFFWLTTYMNSKNTCFPSRKTLAENAGLSLKTVDSALKKLEELGLIAKENRFNKNEQTTNSYYVKIIDSNEKPLNKSKSMGGSVKFARGSVKSTRGSVKFAHRTNSIKLTSSNSIYHSKKNFFAGEVEDDKNINSEEEVSNFQLKELINLGLDSSSFRRETPEEIKLRYLKEVQKRPENVVYSLGETNDGEIRMINHKVSAEEFVNLIWEGFQMFEGLNESYKTLPYTAEQWHALEDILTNPKIGFSGLRKITDALKYHETLDIESYDYVSADKIRNMTICDCVEAGALRPPKAKTVVSIRNECKKLLKFANEVVNYNRCLREYHKWKKFAEKGKKLMEDSDEKFEHNSDRENAERAIGYLGSVAKVKEILEESEKDWFDIDCAIQYLAQENEKVGKKEVMEYWESRK